MNKKEDTPIYDISECVEDDAPLYALNDNPVGGSEEDGADDVIRDDSCGVENFEEIDSDQPLAYRGGSSDKQADSDSAAKASPFGLMLKTMFTPVEGWKALKRSRIKPEDFASRCFYPLVALSTASEATSFLYEANFTYTDLVYAGITTFVSFFFGYFTVLLFGGIMLPPEAKEVMKKPIGKLFVLLNMSTLAIFYTLGRVLPMADPILVFLPIWTIYLVFKGIRILRVPKDKENITTSLLSVLIVGAPILLNWVFTEFLF
ncbi:MAG: hypothetical protein NC204_05540 [Candidatus Amulumruptor caecigallinarius]|nr:hypothetical protein [Candidatus Amulumruptor caecigallinarius]